MSMKSFVNDEKGYETIELMEDSVLYMLERGQLYRLFEEDVHIANWGRKFAEKELLKTEERLIPLLFTTASERYRKLLRDNPELLLRLPLECLASYLGITPVSLSRIRAELRGRARMFLGCDRVGRRKIFLVCKTKSMVSRLESGFRERAKLLSGE